MTNKQLRNVTATAMVSVIIVNWNGKKWLAKCLDSILSQTHDNLEIILVDNASTDDSIDFVSKHYKSVRLVKNNRNVGFAGGNNAGYKHAKGEFILLLNNDAWIEKDFISILLSAFNEIPNLGSVQSKLILADQPSKLDVAGSYWTSSTFLYHYGFGKSQSRKEYNTTKPFFSNKGASMLLSREAIKKVGLFDEDFWCYYEETDLCHRLWLAGYECWYYPKAIAHHAMGGTALQFDNSFIQFHNFKNKLLSFLKNFEVKTLLAVIPVYVLANIVLSIFWLLNKKPRHFLALYRGIGWNILHIRDTLHKRHEIQRLRKQSDKHIFLKVKRNPRLSYYKYLLSGSVANYED